MFSAVDLIWLILLCGGVFYLWRSGQFKDRALYIASEHCKHLGLQLLDHSMVIVGLWPVRDASGRLELRRRYRFEFASIGDRRYQGKLSLIGLHLEHIDLEPYKITPAD